MAAGVVAIQAQVYSANIVGYVNVTCPAGSVATPSFVVIGNPLDASPDNSVGTVFGSSAPADISVLLWNGAGFDENISYGGGVWDDDTVDLSPGKGFFLKNPTTSAVTVTFVGEVNTGTMTNTMNQYFNLVSSMVPQAGNLQDDLGLVAVADDSLLMWNGLGYDENMYYGGGVWDGDPIVTVAQGFFYKENPVAPVHTVQWIRTFNP
jgi:hypothetical protein